MIVKTARGRNGRSRGIEHMVKERYAQGAIRKEEALCCPVSYDGRYLKVLPEEIIEKDYGCGDPTPYVGEGDTVLDLGSGTGKICYIASQIVGPKGRVIGVDFNRTMLDLAKKYQKTLGDRIGWHNVRFLRGRIQDLKITDSSVDVILSNCVLNLVRPSDKKKLFAEMHRVLRKGGRAAISDIVSDSPVPKKMQQDPALWSSCISGAFQEKEFLRAFEEAGFYGIKIEKFSEKPWRVVEGIEFRSVTVVAYKGKEGPCWERNQAVIYQGPWKQVVDDDQHVFRRGVRTAVCDKTFRLLAKAPYREDFVFLQPSREIPLKEAAPFDCSRNPERDPRETKGLRVRKTTKAASTCTDGGCC